MGQNVVLGPEEEKEQGKIIEEQVRSTSSSVFTKIENALQLGGLFKDGVPVEYFKYVVFIMFLGLFYVWLTHKSDRLVRQYENAKSEVKDLKTDYTTLKKSYMYGSKQTEVAKQVKELGLEPSNQPPYKLRVIED